MAADCPATNPKGRQLAFKPCRRFLGRRGLGSRLEQLHYQAVGALALAFEICPVTGRPCFKLRDLRLQGLDLRLESCRACFTSTWWSARVLYLSEINVHQRFPIVRQRALQPESLDKRTSGLWRDFEASA
ncbi:MAG TPA: hypothetical protein VMT72_24235 [Pseudolabrys sp.]|jgi:hypothetical protein|nr:hypothetical protein [Pseudolabrys sp.]